MPPPPRCSLCARITRVQVDDIHIYIYALYARALGYRAKEALNKLAFIEHTTLLFRCARLCVYYIRLCVYVCGPDYISCIKRLSLSSQAPMNISGIGGGGGRGEAHTIRKEHLCNLLARRRAGASHIRIYTRGLLRGCDVKPFCRMLMCGGCGWLVNL